MSGAQVQLEAGGTFVQNPQHTLFSRKYDTREVYVAESFEVPFDRSVPAFGSTASARIPPKGELVRRLTVRSVLPQLYTPLGPGYVYPQYSDTVDGGVYVETSTLAIQPGDFVGYFNTQFLSAWATNFVGYSNLSVAYDSTLNKFVFTGVYSNIFFQNEGSASFWGFDIRSPDFFTASGYPAYNFTGGTLTAPLTLVQAGWIRGFTPPPSNGFSYVDSVATKLIKSATLTVGGQTIDRLTSERLYLEQDLGVAYENQAALTILEGKNDTSVISTPREYYTKLTFNMDTLNMSELYRNDVRVDIEYEKFENLAQNLITTNSLTDGASYLNTQWKSLLGISSTARVHSMIFYKKYVIYVVRVDVFYRFYFYDTTKPVGIASSWSYWMDPTNYGNTNISRPYVIGQTIYYVPTGTYIASVSITDMLTGTAVVTYGPTFLENKYYIFNNQQVYLAGSIYGITSDARYLYILPVVNMLTFGSNTAAFIQDNRFTISSNVSVTFNVYSIATNQLIVSDNNAILSYVNTYTQSPPLGVTKNPATIISETKIGSNVIVVSNVAYTYTSNSDPASITISRVGGNNSTTIWLRYDTTKTITSYSSYDYLTWPDTNAPKSWYDITKSYNAIQSVLYPISDGRYIYTSNGSDFLKVDTQNFLDIASYSNVNVGSISPAPTLPGFFYEPNATDGRYIYFRTAFNTTRTATFIRYDSTKDITSPSAYESFTYTSGPLYASVLAIIPIGFDGKSIYYVGGNLETTVAPPTPTTPATLSIIRVDSTTFTVTDWIAFDGNGGAQSSKGPIVNTIPINLTTYSTGGISASPVMTVGSRYIYIGEQWAGGNQTFTDFIQFDPLTMSNVLSSSSIITKYEKYTAPPKTGKMLYGQTDVETFTIQQGAQTSEFQLRFLNPVRELWISVDAPCVIRRLILRLNGEVLVDDDQVTTKTIRAFESHSCVSNVAVVNFALDPETPTPSGSLNMSRIASPMLEIQLVDMPTAAANVRVYSKSFNVFQANNGTGGLLFNSAF
jgi:hypothetical protein